MNLRIESVSTEDPIEPNPVKKVYPCYREWESDPTTLWCTLISTILETCHVS